MYDIYSSRRNNRNPQQQQQQLQEQQQPTMTTTVDIATKNNTTSTSSTTTTTNNNNSDNDNDSNNNNKQANNLATNNKTHETNYSKYYFRKIKWNPFSFYIRLVTFSFPPFFSSVCPSTLSKSEAPQTKYYWVFLTVQTTSSR